MYKKIMIFITIFFIYISYFSLVIAEASKYHETFEDQKAEKLGSIFDSNGIVLSQNWLQGSKKKIRNKVVTINSKRIWDAALEVLSNIPLLSTDLAGGVIITDWYFPDCTKDVSCKATTLIKNVKNIPIDIKNMHEIIKVFVHCKNLKQIDASNSVMKLNSDLSDMIFNKIIGKINMQSGSRVKK